MQREICPYLGVLNPQKRREPPVEFPSFENYCLATGAGELIVLGDQATFCLSDAHRTCPRYITAREEAAVFGGESYIPLYTTAEEAWDSNTVPDSPISGLDTLAAGTEEDERQSSRRRWTWLGAGLVFATVFLCGSMVATYTGWQWISRNLPARAAAGRVDTAVAAEPTPLVYLVVTATPIAAQSEDVLPPTAPVIPLQPNGDTAFASPGADGTALAYPPAVTPTPILINPAPPSLAGDGDAEPGNDPNAEPPIDVQLAVPTRRPTPIFDLPTSTPLAEEPVAPPTPTPTPFGPPIVVFGADDKELKKGKCTMVRWSVENVRAVYYENLPMSGIGEREECINDHNEIYTLMVVLPDGSSQIYTTTVSYLPPTPTPTVTPSFTPEPEFTPTWTPVPPTLTPTPNVRRATNLAVNGSASISCDRGQTCEVGLLVTNSGDAIDDLTVIVVQGGAFPLQLCRLDGVCAGNDLPLASVGPSNTAYITARFSIPGDAAAQRTTYGLQAASEGSGRSVVSGVVSIEVTVP